MCFHQYSIAKAIMILPSLKLISWLSFVRGVYRVVHIVIKQNAKVPLKEESTKA